MAIRNWIIEKLLALSYRSKVSARILAGEGLNYEKEEIHAQQRLRERYGIHDFDRVQAEIKNILTSKKYWRYRRRLLRSGDVALWEVKLRGRPFYFWYAKKQHRVVTFLTAEMAEREIHKFNHRMKALQDRFGG